MKHQNSGGGNMALLNIRERRGRMKQGMKEGMKLRASLLCGLTNFHYPAPLMDTQAINKP